MGVNPELMAQYEGDNKVFLAEVENLGYDATGRPKAGSEVKQVVEEFHKQVGW